MSATTSITNTYYHILRRTGPRSLRIGRSTLTEFKHYDRYQHRHQADSRSYHRHNNAICNFLGFLFSLLHTYSISAMQGIQLSCHPSSEFYACQFEFELLGQNLVLKPSIPDQRSRRHCSSHYEAWKPKASFPLVNKLILEFINLSRRPIKS